MQYISYAIPVLLLMLQKRHIPRPGPFYLGNWGWLANGLLVAWTGFTLVFYSFPYILPVTRGNMSMVPRVEEIMNYRSWLIKE